MGCTYLLNAYYVITFCCFTHVFVDSARKQLTTELSQAHNLLRPNNLPGDLTDDLVNNLKYLTVVDETGSCRLLIM